MKELDTLRMKYDHLLVMRDAACNKFLANYVEWHNFKKWWNEFKTYDTVPQKIKAFIRATKDGVIPVSKRVSQPPPSVLRMTGEVDQVSDVDIVAVVETQHEAIRTALGNGHGILEDLARPSPEVPTALLRPIEKATKTHRSSQATTDDDQTQDYTPPRPSAPRPVIIRPNLAPVPPPDFNPPDTPIDPTEEEESPFVRSLPSMSPILSSHALISSKPAEENDTSDRDPAVSERITKAEPTSPIYIPHSNVPSPRQTSGYSFPDFPPTLEMCSPSNSERQGSSSLLGKRKLDSTADVTMAGSPETPNALELKKKRQRFNDFRALHTDTERGPSTPEDPYAKYKGRGRYAQSTKKSVYLLGLNSLQLTNEPAWLQGHIRICNKRGTESRSRICIR